MAGGFGPVAGTIGLVAGAFRPVAGTIGPVTGVIPSVVGAISPITVAVGKVRFSGKYQSLLQLQMIL